MRRLCHKGPPSGFPAPALTPRPSRPLIHWHVRAHPPAAAHELAAASPLPCLCHPCRISRYQTTSSPTSHDLTPLLCHRTMDGLPAPAFIPPLARPLRYRSNQVGPDTAQFKGPPHSLRCTSVRSPFHLDVPYKGPRRHFAAPATVHMARLPRHPRGAHRQGPSGSTGLPSGEVTSTPSRTVGAHAARRARRLCRPFPRWRTPSGPLWLDGRVVGGGDGHVVAHRRGPCCSTGASLLAATPTAACTVGVDMDLRAPR